jgi:hypothetical protein
LGIVKGGREEIVRVPLSDHFVVLPLPLFHFPYFFAGKEFSSVDPKSFSLPKSFEGGISISGTAAVWFTDPEAIRQMFAAERIFVIQKVDAVAFGQMLAKIAYSLAVAELGMDAFEENYILPVIMGKTETIGMWVGSSDSVLDPTPGVQHTTQITSFVRPNTDNERFTVAYIRLFSDLPSPVYIVVLGRPRR